MLIFSSWITLYGNRKVDHVYIDLLCLAWFFAMLQILACSLNSGKIFQSQKATTNTFSIFKEFKIGSANLDFFSRSGLWLRWFLWLGDIGSVGCCGGLWFRWCPAFLFLLGFRLICHWCCFILLRLISIKRYFCCLTKFWVGLILRFGFR